MTMNTIALAGFLFISAAAAAEPLGHAICFGGPSGCSDSYPGYNHTIQNPITKGSVTFEGLDLGNITSNAPPANWIWELSVGNYSSGGNSTQIHEVYSLRIPLEMEMNGPNVSRNVCAIVLPAKEGAGTNDPGDCSTIFDSSDIMQVTGAGVSGSFPSGGSPCAGMMLQIYGTLGYESNSGGSLSSVGVSDTRTAEIDTGILRVYNEIPVDESQAAIDASLTRVQPIYLRSYSAVEGDEATSQVALSCLHVGNSVRGVMVGMGSVIASAVITVGLLMI
ncbi:hypothetical protein EMPG_10061 [Blastomyces silverae]|uniref:Uncharacterized protein n=1 Tax=Blastomyces silverae TaxID=2060906 RepID=A0A0H1B636_9EURO|nr:hypothetical protein EMPG_10061 [Blastomyces silverae]